MLSAILLRCHAARRGLASNVLRSCATQSPSQPSLLADFSTAGHSGTDSDTVAAIITHVVPCSGGVAIVRLSGREAVSVVRSLFRQGPPSKPSRGFWNVESHRAVYGGMYDEKGQLADEVLVLPMLAPRSYTREDVVEVHCHGGSVCVQRVLQLCLRSGARLATPGEFTLRAFLNGAHFHENALPVRCFIAHARTT